MAGKFLLIMVAIMAWTVSIAPHGIKTDQFEDFGCDGRGCVDSSNGDTDIDADSNGHLIEKRKIEPTVTNHTKDGGHKARSGDCPQKLKCKRQTGASCVPKGSCTQGFISIGCSWKCDCCTPVPVECYVGNGKMWTGQLSVTTNGKTCQRWNVQKPHEHLNDPSVWRENNVNTENYCRNPDGETGPWCYTTDKHDRWQYCDVPKCISTTEVSTTANPTTTTSKPTDESVNARLGEMEQKLAKLDYLIRNLVCYLGRTLYQNGDVYQSECFELQCNYGTWEFNVIENTECGKCNAEGDPHIITFDESSVFVGDCTSTTTTSTSTITPCPKTTTNKYLLNRCGTYIVSQPGLPYPAEFGVNSNFEYCDYLLPTYAGQCIVSTTYYEDSHTLIMIPPPAWIAATCVVGSTAPRCAIEVIFNGSPLTVGGGYIPGTLIAVIQTTYTCGTHPCNCMTIIGTKGFIVTLCQNDKNYPYMFIQAASSLKSDPTYPLSGLCNTFTGDTAYNMVKRNGFDETSVSCLEYTATLGDYEVCEVFSDSWKFPV